MTTDPQVREPLSNFGDDLIRTWIQRSRAALDAALTERAIDGTNSSHKQRTVEIHHRNLVELLDDAARRGIEAEPVAGLQELVTARVKEIAP